jgi:hypothetical protein
MSAASDNFILWFKCFYECRHLGVGLFRFIASWAGVGFQIAQDTPAASASAAAVDTVAPVGAALLVTKAPSAKALPKPSATTDTSVKNHAYQLMASCDLGSFGLAFEMLRPPGESFSSNMHHPSQLFLLGCPVCWVDQSGSD